MGLIKNIGQKIEGKLDQGKGKVNQSSRRPGDRIKGGFQEIKGKIKEAAADVKLREDKRRADEDI